MAIWGRGLVYVILPLMAFCGLGRAEPLPEAITVSAAKSSAVHDIATAVLERLYDRAGIKLTVRRVPSKRSLNEANTGYTGGDAARIAGTENEYPHLVPVPIPVMTIRGVAFTVHVDAQVSNWEDLRPYRVGIKRGVRFAEIGTRGLKREFANSVPQLFRFLVDGYVDIIVTPEVDGRRMIASKFAGQDIHRIGMPLHETPLFHYLHKSNASLIAPLSAILETMQKEGELEDIRDRVMANLVEAY